MLVHTQSGSVYELDITAGRVAKCETDELGQYWPGGFEEYIQCTFPEIGEPLVIAFENNRWTRTSPVVRIEAEIDVR